MNKNQLKNYIKTIDLESEIEASIFDLIDQQEEVTQELMNLIADIIDMQADFYNNSATLLEELAQVYSDLKDNVEEANLARENEKLDLMIKNKEEILQMINDKIEKLKNS